MKVFNYSYSPKPRETIPMPIGCNWNPQLGNIARGSGGGYVYSYPSLLIIYLIMVQV